MSLSPEIRAQLLKKTQEQAVVLLDDLQHLREVVGKEQTNAGEIRRLSGVLRRLLVSREIANIATPRIGRIEFSAPDNTPFYKAENKVPLFFFLSGRAKIFGWSGALWAFSEPLDTTAQQLLKKSEEFVGDLTIDCTVSLRLEGFLRQRVIFYRDQWATREDVIKYVANVASGVHTTEAKDEKEILIAQIRSSNRIFFKDGGVHVELLDKGPYSVETNFEYKADSIDPVLIEILATARFLTESPMVENLESIIREEVEHMSP